MLTTDRFAHVQSCRALWCEHLKELNLGSRFILHNGDVSLAKGKGFLSWLSCPAAERKRWLFKGDSCYLYSKMVTNAYPSFKQDPFTETIGLGGEVTALCFLPTVSNVLHPPEGSLSAVSGQVELDSRLQPQPQSSIIPMMFSPPESLLASCILRGNFAEAHQVTGDLSQ